MRRESGNPTSFPEEMPGLWATCFRTLALVERKGTGESTVIPNPLAMDRKKWVTKAWHYDSRSRTAKCEVSANRGRSHRYIDHLHKTALLSTSSNSNSHKHINSLHTPLQQRRFQTKFFKLFPIHKNVYRSQRPCSCPCDPLH